MRNNHKMKILGLTGGIAAGKSAVAELLRKKKGYILDADKLSHEAILKGTTAYEEILSKIDGEYLLSNGEIDRGKLGSIVFNDKNKLKLLEGIVHNYVHMLIMEKITEINENPCEYRFIVMDAPLLLESGTDKLCDAIWIVSADYETRLKRIMDRNCLTKEQAANRIKIQTDWDKIQNNSYIFINNSGNMQDLIEKVYENLESFLEN